MLCPAVEGVEERYAIVDASSAPVLHVRVVGPLTDPGFERYMRELEDAMTATERFGIVLEQGPLTAFPARYGRRSAVWLKEAVARFGERWVATAFVVTSPALRAAVRGLFWTLGQAHPVTVTATPEEAFAWVRARLGEEAR